MDGIVRYISAGAVLVAGLAACGEGGEAQQVAAATVGGGKPPCPSVTEVQAAIGFPVQSRPVPVDGCLYELSGEYAGVMVSLMYQPAARAEDIYADIRRGVQGARGMDAQPDKLTVGEGGWGYTSRGQKHAAAVSKGRVYHVEIDHNLFESLAFPDDVAVKVIELGMRVAPGPGAGAGAGAATASAAGASSAPIDACTLATNAEVADAAEERPEIAKYWSAPVASFGNSHCDYDGGSIRVYRGKNAAASFESTLKAFGAEKAPRTAVAGLGDRAYFLIPYPDDPYKRLGLLAVHQGSDVLQFIFDARGDEPIEATRPRLEKLARLVLPRVQ
ncbi:MAG TPA: hypothetical protein VF037_00215 [Gemmatimonadales bacterium]